MKISLIHPSLRNRGGAERVVMKLAASLAGRGHRVQLLTPEYDAAYWGAPEVLPFRLIRLETPPTRSMTIRGEHYARQICRACAGDDVINPHNFPATYWVAAAKRASDRFPRTVWYCEEPPRGLHQDRIDEHVKKAFPPRLGPPWKWFRRWRRKRKMGLMRERDLAAVAELDLILANSRFTADNVRRIYGREANACHLGVDDPFPGGLPARPGKEGPYFITVTRLHAFKNVGAILEALGSLGRRLEGWRLLIVGEGELESRIRARIRMLGMSDRVSLTGFLPDAALAEVLGRARFSIYIPLDEPFGLVPLEAGILGVPSLVSDHGGPSETVLDGRTGWHVDPLDPRAVAERIAAIVGDDEGRRRAGLAAREWIREGFLWEHFLARFLGAVEGPA